MANPIVNLFNAIGNWLDDFARSLRNGRSSEALLDETVESMHNAFGQSYEAVKSANGQIEITLKTLAQTKSAASTAHMNVNRAVRDAKDMTGQELQIQQAKIVGFQQIATHADQAVAAMQATIEKAQGTQSMVEGKVAVEATNMQLRESIARTNVAMENLWGTMERVADNQMRASGLLDTPTIQDHSGELSRRASNAKGRAESAQRLVDQTVGNPFADKLSDGDMEVLKAAYEAAGAKMPETQAASTEQSAN
jgi:hypothetical protein